MRKLILRYILLTYMITILCWGICVLCGYLSITLNSFPLLYILYILGGLSPTIVSYLMFKRLNRSATFLEWVRSVFDLKRSITSYILSVGLACVYIFSMVLVSGYNNGMPLYSVIFLIPFMLFMGGLEETGWRGFLQPELEKQIGYISACVIVAVIWWVWHLPLFYIPVVGQYGTNFLYFGVNVLALSFALAAIRRITKSVWLCVLFHCIVNSLHSVFVLEENLIADLVSAILVISISLLIVILDKRIHLTKKQDNNADS